jgi:hypothetical protein
MDIIILTQQAGLTKYFKANIEVPCMKKDLSMKITFDTVSAKERLKTPFNYHWLKFKTYFFSNRGILRANKR